MCKIDYISRNVSMETETKGTIKTRDSMIPSTSLKYIVEGKT